MANDGEKLRLELVKAAIADASRAVSNLVLINGAAAISVMALVGSVAASRHVSTAQFSPIRSGLVCFVVGVVTATVTTGLSYLINSKFSEAWAIRGSNEPEKAPKVERRARGWLWCGVAFALVSLACFGAGVWFVANGITGLSVSVPDPPAPE